MNIPVPTLQDLPLGDEYLRSMLDATGEAVFATDGQSDDEPARFTNDRLFALWGIPTSLRGRLTTTLLLQYLRPQLLDADGALARMDAMIAAGVSAEGQLALRDGRVFALRFACAQVRGRMLRVWTSHDITAETRVAAEQRALLDNFPGYISVVDEDNRYRYVNTPLTTLLGKAVDEVVGHRIAEVLGETRALALYGLLQQARQVGRSVSDSRYPHPDGNGSIDLQVTHVAATPRPDGTRLIYSFGIDITERKRAQSALIEVLGEAERANSAKSQFLSSMSHELRTPLHAVLGFSQVLAQQPLAPQQRHQIDEIVRGGRHLLDLIDDLFDLGRIEAGDLQVNVEPTDALTIIDDCVGLLAPLAERRALQLRHVRPPGPPGPPPTVWADARRLRQVLLNLLSNAIKYNRDQGEVRVETERLEDQLEFRVHDNGPGLSAEDQRRLFRPFERLDAGSRGIDGSGIGLALSRSLVDAMGGQIGVISQPGHGSSFWFRLRLAPPQPLPALHPQPGLPPARRLRALYIEDNAVNQELMAAMLENELDLLVEADPLKGLALATAEDLDLVLLDIRLPGISGYEVLRRLRADPRSRHLPVVAVSANAVRADLAAGQAAGFDAYLTKPVHMDDLLATVRRVTGGG